MKTGKIKFKFQDIGRMFSGKNRGQVDPKKVSDAINSPAVQEKLKNRDLLGFYGHWARIKFGFEPAEGGLASGKAVNLEPAIVTTYLKALPDGTIEHEAEFLPTEAGKLARKLHESRVGGFSTAFKFDARGVLEFFGFDYVTNPNNNANRGYLLDSTGGEFSGGVIVAGDVLVLDSMVDDATQIASEIEAIGVMSYQSDVNHLNQLLDSIAYERDIFNQTVKQLEEEREQLLSMLSAKTGHTGAMLDDLMGGGESIKPMVISKADNHILDAINAFDKTNLPPASKFTGDDAKQEFDPSENASYRRFKSGLLRG